MSIRLISSFLVRTFRKMVSDRMGARAVHLLLGQINDSEGPPQEVVMRSLLKVLFMVRLPSHRLLSCFVTRRRLTNLVLSAQPTARTPTTSALQCRAASVIENEDPTVLLQSMSRFFKFLPGDQRQAFLHEVTEEAS
jgi:hypothetical protein